jgi:hypothetical protein
MLFPAKREPILPIAVIKAILAANPVGQRRQSYSMDFKPKTCQNFIQSRLTSTHWPIFQFIMQEKNVTHEFLQLKLIHSFNHDH